MVMKKITRNIIRIFLFGLFLFFQAFSTQGQEASEAVIPEDADELEFTKVSIYMPLPRNQTLVEGGLAAAVLVGSEFLVDANMVWTDGTNMASVVSVDDAIIRKISGKILDEFKQITPVYTYSTRFQGVEKKPELGMHYIEYSKSISDTARARLQMSAIKGDYTRNIEISVPWEDVDQFFWYRLNHVLPVEGEFEEIIEKLKVFWRNNSQ